MSFYKKSRHFIALKCFAKKQSHTSNARLLTVLNRREIVHSTAQFRYITVELNIDVFMRVFSVRQTWKSRHLCLVLS